MARPVLYDIQEKGRCRGADPDLFFPSDGDTLRDDEDAEDEVVGYLREFYCNPLRCSVFKKCYDDRVPVETVGVWAGTTSRERRTIKAAAKRAAKIEGAA